MWAVLKRERMKNRKPVSPICAAHLEIEVQNRSQVCVVCPCRHPLECGRVLLCNYRRIIFLLCLSVLEWKYTQWKHFKLKKTPQQVGLLLVAHIGVMHQWLVVEFVVSRKYYDSILNIRSVFSSLYIKDGINSRTNFFTTNTNWHLNWCLNNETSSNTLFIRITNEKA